MAESAKTLCPECGSELPRNAPAGLCPLCLMQLALEASGETRSGPLRADGADEDQHRSASPEHGRTLAAEPAAGQVVKYFGDYELLEEVARGGMGIVYRARQTRLNRIVALKMIRSGQFASSADVERFHAEAEAIAQLDHPSIVPIFEVGEHQGYHFYSMAFVDGPSLAEQLAAGPLAPREAAQLLLRVAEAMHYAHERGLIHRDLKPANILIDAERQPRVTDFGLVKRTDGGTGLTGTGQVLGTPAYMSPEQAAGTERQVTPASDIHALGAILYCTLTGRPPFQSASVVDVLKQVLEQEPVSARQLNAQVPVDLATVASKCLQKNPAKRYATAGDMADDLQRWLQGKPILARPVGPLERLQKWVVRHPVTTALLAALFASLVGGTFVSTRFAAVARERAKEAESRAAEVSAEREKVREQLWQSLVQQARAERLTGERWESLDALRRAAEIKQTAELRREAIQTITSAGVRLLHEIPFGRVETMAISSDSRLLAVSGQHPVDDGDWSKTEVVVWDMDSGRKLARTQTSHGYVAPPGFQFRPNSPQILLPHRDDYHLWSPTAASPSPAAAEHPVAAGIVEQNFPRDTGAPELSARFHSSGRLLAVRRKHQLVVFDIREHSEAAELDGAKPIAFLSDHTLLVDHQQRIKRWNFTENTFEPVFPDGVTLLELAETGETAVVRDGSEFVIWDVVSGTKAATLPPELAPIENIHLSPDGRLLAVQIRNDRNAIRVWQWRTDTWKPILTGLAGVYADAFDRVAFHPDGSLLAAHAGNGVVKVWDVETGETLGVLHGTSIPVWSPDGAYLATRAKGMVDLPNGTASSSDQAIAKVWHIVRPTKTYVVSDIGEIDAISIHPDGKQLATRSVSWDLLHVSDGTALRRSEASPGTFDNRGRRWALQAGTHQGSESGVTRQNITVTSTGTQIDEAQFEVAGRYLVHQFSPDGKRLAITTALWEFAPWQTSGAFSHGGFALELRDLENDRLLWRHTESRNTAPYTSLRFSPDSQRLAVGRQNVGVEIWDVGSGTRQHTISFGGSERRGTTDAPGDLAFSSDGRHVLAASVAAQPMHLVILPSVQTGGTFWQRTLLEVTLW